MHMENVVLNISNIGHMKNVFIINCELLSYFLKLGVIGRTRVDGKEFFRQVRSGPLSLNFENHRSEFRTFKLY